MRIELSDPTRLSNLYDYFAGVQANASIVEKAVVGDLIRPPSRADLRRPHAYLDTWVAPAAASSQPVEVTVNDT